MSSSRNRLLKRSVTAVGLALAAMSIAAQPHVADNSAGVLNQVRVLGTAEQELKQAPGVSTITAEDIAKKPPVNDLAEIILITPMKKPCKSLTCKAF